MNKNVHSHAGSTEGLIDWDKIIAEINDKYLTILKS